MLSAPRNRLVVVPLRLVLVCSVIILLRLICRLIEVDLVDLLTRMLVMNANDKRWRVRVRWYPVHGVRDGACARCILYIY